LFDRIRDRRKMIIFPKVYFILSKVERRNRRKLLIREGIPMQRFATTTAAATCNTLIDPVRVNSFARTNEAISTSTSFLFFTYLTSSSFFANHDLLSFVRVTDIYVVHCANAKYVGRNFLFAQRFSNSLPAFRTFT